MDYKTRIKFVNKEWLVIDNIEFNNIKYFYIIEDTSENLNNINNINELQKKYNAEFIYKLDNGNYKNVTDKNLINQLLNIIAQKMIHSSKK